MIKLNYRPSVGSSLPLKLTFRDDFGAYYIPTKLKYSVVAQSADKQSWRVVDDLQDVYVEDLASEVWIPIKDLKIYKDTTPTRRVIIEWTAMINGMETPCLEEVHFEVAPTSNHEYEYDSVEDVDVNIIVKGLVALIGDEETDGTMLHRIKTNEDEIQDIHESIDSINSEIGADDVSGTVKGRIFQNETDINLTNTRIDSEVETLNDRIDSEVQTLNERIDDEVETINRRIDNEVSTLNDKIDSEIDTIDDKIDNEVQTLDSKIDSETSRLDDDIKEINDKIGGDVGGKSILTRLDEAEENVSTLLDSVDNIHEVIGDELTDESLSHRISDNDSRIKSIEERIDWGGETPDEIKIFGMIDSRINDYDNVVDGKIETVNDELNKKFEDVKDDVSEQIDSLNEIKVDDVQSVGTFVRSFEKNIIGTKGETFHDDITKAIKGYPSSDNKYDKWGDVYYLTMYKDSNYIDVLSIINSSYVNVGKRTFRKYNNDNYFSELLDLKQTDGSYYYFTTKDYPRFPSRSNSRDSIVEYNDDIAIIRTYKDSDTKKYTHLILIPKGDSYETIEFLLGDCSEFGVLDVVWTYNNDLYLRHSRMIYKYDFSYGWRYLATNENISGALNILSNKIIFDSIDYSIEFKVDTNEFIKYNHVGYESTLEYYQDDVGYFQLQNGEETRISLSETKSWKPIDDYILIEKPQSSFDGNYKIVCENGNFKLVADE